MALGGASNEGRDPAPRAAPWRTASGRLFLACAVLALALHAAFALRGAELRGGADLVPHLRLIEWMGESPALRTVYAPAYHAIGALLAPAVGLAATPRLFAFLSAAALIFAFRFFQRAAGLPDAASALFALSPYALTLSYCLPKVEFAGHAVGLVGLGLLLRRRYVGVALCAAAAFLVHTMAALVFGLAAGVLALARRDGRALLALTAGALAASPLFAAHMASGCSLAQSFLFSRSGYLGHPALAAAPLIDARGLLRVVMLASPVALLAAVLGVRAAWHRHREVAIVALVLVAFYLNSLWLAPFGVRTGLGLQRGLSVLALPIAIFGGVWLVGRPRFAPALLLACGLFAVGSAVAVVPDACFVRPIALDEIRDLRVARCRFSWNGPNLRVRRLPPPRVAPGAG